MATTGGSATRAIQGLIMGALIGLPAGFILYLVLRETVIPTDLWSSEGLQWGINLAVMALFGGIGFTQGAWPSRGGGALRAGTYGFIWGALMGGVAGGALAILLGALLGASQREGAFAMGVAFGVIPLAGVVGGVALALRQGLRAWHRWPAG